MSSVQAISQVQRIDFLHLDGNFSEEGSTLDCRLYLPKVIPGGYVLCQMLRLRPKTLRRRKV